MQYYLELIPHPPNATTDPPCHGKIVQNELHGTAEVVIPKIHIDTADQMDRLQKMIAAANEKV